MTIWYSFSFRESFQFKLFPTSMNYSIDLYDLSVQVDMTLS